MVRTTAGERTPSLKQLDAVSSGPLFLSFCFLLGLPFGVSAVARPAQREIWSSFIRSIYRGVFQK